MADLQLFEDVWLDVAGAAAGAEAGEIGADALEAADALPFRAVPTMGAAGFHPVAAADEGGDELDAEAVGGVEFGVIDAVGEGVGKGGVVLGIDSEAVEAGEFREDGDGEGAGGAVALHHGDEAVIREGELALRHGGASWTVSAWSVGRRGGAVQRSVGCGSGVS